MDLQAHKAAIIDKTEDYPRKQPSGKKRRKRN